MADRAGADRRVRQAVGLRLGGGEHIGERLEIVLGVDREQIRRGRDQHHRIEILLGVVLQIHQIRIDRVRVEHEQPGVAVRRRFGEHRGAGRAGGARLVLDDDVGAEPLLQPGLHQPRKRVGRAAGRKRHDEADRTGRPSLCLRHMRHERQRGRAGNDGSSGQFHPWLRFFFSILCLGLAA
jgi:hypothetical protein